MTCCASPCVEKVERIVVRAPLDRVSIGKQSVMTRDKRENERRNVIISIPKRENE